MTIPRTSATAHAVMRLIGGQPGHWIETDRAYALLTPQFPELTYAEKTVPFHTSRSHFANRVLTAVNSLKNDGWLERAPVSGKAVWRFTAKAEASWGDAFPDADELFAEMLAMAESTAEASGAPIIRDASAAPAARASTR
jgi:hypothetical protein